MSRDLTKLNEVELLKLHASIIEELKTRKVVRTNNNPVGDYAEWLVSRGLNLELARNSATGYDAIDGKGSKYQVKARRVSLENKSRLLSPIRKLAEKDFDFLVVIVFEWDYSIIDAVEIPHEVVSEYASFSKHTNGHILHLRGNILKDPRTRDIEELLSR